MKRLVGTALALAALAAPLAASAADGPVTVVVTTKGCEPAEITVPAGEVTFLIVNKGTRALEWEILSGVMVVDERENIAPGFKQKLTTELKPGEYAITCGLLSNPRGRLIATAGGAVGGPVRPSATDLIAPTAEYRVFLAGETDGLIKAANEVAAALKAGDKSRAAAALGAAKIHFDHLRPAIAEAETGFADSLKRMDADGQSENAGDRLVADAKALQARLMASTLTPRAMVNGAAQTLTQIADAKDAGQDRKAAIDGARKVVDLMQPLLVRADGALSERLKVDFAAIDTALGRADQGAADTALRALTADAAKLTPALGLD